MTGAPKSGQPESGVYLSAYLAPLRPYLEREGVTDIWINRPGELWLEHAGGRTERVAAPELTDLALERLARQIAATNHQGFNREQPLVSASLPDGARVQIVGPPATREGVALAIRRHGLSDLSLGELAGAGLFSAAGKPAGNEEAQALRALLDARDQQGFLARAVALRKTIVISGGTSSGKTTLMNALVKQIGAHERLVTIEDTPEVRLAHENVVAMIATRGDGGEARVDTGDLLQAALRMRPDRILLGELRGAEAFAFLRAVNTGHPGSITTIHADSAAGALDQIAMLSLLGGVSVSWEAIGTYIRQVIDIVVQLTRVNGQRQVTEILYLER